METVGSKRVGYSLKQVAVGYLDVFCLLQTKENRRNCSLSGLFTFLEVLRTMLEFHHVLFCVSREGSCVPLLSAQPYSPTLSMHAVLSRARLFAFLRIVRGIFTSLYFFLNDNIKVFLPSFFSSPVSVGRDCSFVS